MTVCTFLKSTNCQSRDQNATTSRDDVIIINILLIIQQSKNLLILQNEIHDRQKASTFTILISNGDCDGVISGFQLTGASIIKIVSCKAFNRVYKLELKCHIIVQFILVRTTLIGKKLSTGCLMPVILEKRQVMAKNELGKKNQFGITQMWFFSSINFLSIFWLGYKLF